MDFCYLFWDAYRYSNYERWNMSYPKNTIIVEPSEEDRLANHTPESVWKLSRDNNVWIKDKKTGELIQVLDCLTD